MKNLYFGFSLLAVILLSACSGSRQYTQGGYADQNYNSAPEPTITYQQFYDDLSPYGNWVNYQDYGYVWVPNVSGFRPYYSNGHWVYTSYGWTWVSDYNWGWAPFHYGRWMQDMTFGWVWIPGYEWGPAWVSWRGGGDYYGWAPLGPQNGYGRPMQDNWTFVPRRYINSPRINNYYVNQSRNVTIINNTTVINNTIINKGNNRPAYNGGPAVNEVEQATGSKIRRFNVVESNKPGSPQVDKNSIRVFRPVVKQEAANSTNIRPARVFNRQDIEADKQRNNSQGTNVPQQPATQNNNTTIPAPQKTREFDNRNRPQQPVTNPATNQPAANQGNPANNNGQNNPPANVPSRPARNFDHSNPAANDRPNTPAPSNDQPIVPVQKNEPSNNIPPRPQRPFNNEKPANIPANHPVTQPPTNNPPANVPPKQPARRFNNGESPIMNRQHIPATQTQPVDQQHQRTTTPPAEKQLRNNEPMRQQHQPQINQRNERTEGQPQRQLREPRQPEIKSNEKE